MKKVNHIVGNLMNGNKHVPVFLYTASRISGISILTTKQFKTLTDGTTDPKELLENNLVIKVQQSVSGGYWETSALKYKNLPEHSMLFELVGKNPIVKLYRPLKIFEDVGEILQLKGGIWSFKKSDLLSEPVKHKKEIIAALEVHIQSVRDKIPDKAKVFIRPSNRPHKTVAVKIHYEL